MAEKTHFQKRADEIGDMARLKDLVNVAEDIRRLTDRMKTLSMLGYGYTLRQRMDDHRIMASLLACFIELGGKEEDLVEM